jgi:hypothetical protein
MGLFGKSKKQSISPVNSGPTSPSSPRVELRSHPGSPGTPRLSKATRRASGFFDLSFSNESETVPPPAPVQLVHEPGAELSPIGKSALKSQKVSSFYESIPQISTIASKRYPSSGSSTDIPPVLLKPPRLSSHKREPSDVDQTDFDNFDGVYISEDADVAQESNNSLHEPKQQQEQLDQTLTQHEKKVNTLSSFIPPASSTQLDSTQMSSFNIPSQPTDNAKSNSSVASPASSRFLVSNLAQASAVNPSASHSSQSPVSSPIEPQSKSVNIQPITIPHVSESLRPPINSPSATAAAIASASAKSNLKIGTVRVIESQQANVEYGTGDFYSGFEGFSGQEISAENSQSSSDDDDAGGKNVVDDHTPNNPSIQAHTNIINTINHVKSESDSSYVNVPGQNNDSDSLSSGVIVPRQPSPATDSLVESYSHIYSGFNFDDPLDESLTKTVTENSVASVSGPSHDSAAVDLANNDYQHQRQVSQLSQLSSTSSFLSEYEDTEKHVYHPQPQRADAGILGEGTGKLRASVVSTASSNILESSGGVPNFDTLSISDTLNLPRASGELSARQKALQETQAQLLEGGGNAKPHRSMPPLQRRSSYGRTLSTFMPAGSSTNFRASHMDPPVNGHNGIYYPAPIPVELKLPPLLSKKNVEKAKVGRPISRRPGSMLQIGRMEFPAPPIWHVDGATAGDRHSFMSRRLSNASTLNAFDKSTAERESVLSPSRSVFSKESNSGTTPSGEAINNAETSSLEKEHDDEHDGNQPHGKHKGEHNSKQPHDDENPAISGQESNNEGSENPYNITSPVEGRFGELRDDSWRREPSWQERRYSQSILAYYDDESDDDGIKSDAATIESDEEYQEDMLGGDDDPESGEASKGSMNPNDPANAKNSNIDDFAFTSFNPNNAITDRGLLAGSISYSSQLAPAVGIQPPSLIEELEMRKAGRKARLQRVYYDSTTGNAIATETIGNAGPDSEQLIRLPNSGHPLDYRHTKTLLELQQIAKQEYEEQKSYHHHLQVAVESDRMSRMGLSTPNLLASTPQPVFLDEEEGVDPNESLGARRARLKKKKLEAQTEGTETLAERRARLKREKQAKKEQEKENLIDVQPSPQLQPQLPEAVAT